MSGALFLSFLNTHLNGTTLNVMTPIANCLVVMDRVLVHLLVQTILQSRYYHYHLIELQ